MKTLIFISIISATMVLISGCCSPKTIFVDRNVTVNIPVKCIVPDVNCTFSGNGIEVIAGLHSCILTHIEAEKVCK